jgi:hypothetical protein
LLLPLVGIKKVTPIRQRAQASVQCLGGAFKSERWMICKWNLLRRDISAEARLCIKQGIYEDLTMHIPSVIELESFKI